ncbi:MAG: hypothetical protein NT080_03820 [Spirochaetes bacterium]|nr:hypothetical protein [Spirochaetota bacterium]
MARREAELDKGVYRSGFWQAVAENMESVTVEGTRVAASSSLAVDPDALTASWEGGDWGADFGWQAAYRPRGGKALVNWVGYAGLALRYERLENGDMSLVGQGFLSPLLAESFRLGPVVATFGIDAEGIAQLGAVSDRGYLAGACAGGMAALETKYKGRSGFFAAAKGDYRWYPEDETRSGYALRLLAGFSF